MDHRYPVTGESAGIRFQGLIQAGETKCKINRPALKKN